MTEQEKESRLIAFPIDVRVLTEASMCACLRPDSNLQVNILPLRHDEQQIFDLFRNN